MSASGKHHRSTPTEILYALWLTFDQKGNVRLNRESPRLSAEITVPDPGQPGAIAARIEQFAEQLKTAVGCDVVLTVKPAEEPR